MSDVGTAYLLVRCDHCGAVQATSVNGGSLLDCCGDQNSYDASLTHAEQTGPWKPTTDIIGQKPENHDGLHLGWKQGTDGYWLMLGNKRLAEVAGHDLAAAKSSVSALNELLASIPATQIKEHV